MSAVTKTVARAEAAAGRLANCLPHWLYEEGAIERQTDGNLVDAAYTLRSAVGKRPGRTAMAARRCATALLAVVAARGGMQAEG